MYLRGLQRLNLPEYQVGRGPAVYKEKQQLQEKWVISPKLRHFIQERCDGLFPQTVVLRFVEMEKQQDGRIGHRRENAAAVVFVDKELRQGEQCNRLGLFEEGIDTVLKDVFGSWTPVVRPEIAQDAEERGNHERIAYCDQPIATRSGR